MSEADEIRGYLLVLQGCTVRDDFKSRSRRIPDSLPEMPEMRSIVPKCREG